MSEETIEEAIEEKSEEKSEDTSKHKIFIHLSAIDVESLIKAAQTSIQLSDDGEAFAEEAYACLSEEEIESIEARYKSSIEDFFIQQAFQPWDEGEPNDVPIFLMDALAELNIEMTFEEPGDYFEEDDWDDEYDRELGEDEPM